MKVYVVIVTYNAVKWIDKCFLSLRASSIPIHTIVIDNCSEDDTVKLISENYPEVELINFSGNLGFGKANNIGIGKAYARGADYVLLLNQDAWIEPDTIEKIIYFHQRDKSFDIISPMHLDGTGTKLDFNFSTYISAFDCEDLISDIYMNRVKSKLYQVKFVNAACWLMTRRCIETVGGFNPFFYHYGEDNNYIERLHYHKLKMAVCPVSIIYHDRNQINTSSYSRREKQNSTGSLLKYLNPNRPENIDLELRSLKSNAFYFLITFRLGKAYLKYIEYKAVKSDSHKIRNNIKICSSKGLTFINEL